MNPWHTTICAALVFSGCGNGPQTVPEKAPAPVFELLLPDSTGVRFSNDIRETRELNYYTFMHLYMGGGVAAGDLNNDGLPDLVFTGNISPSAIYLNNGGFHFEDITAGSGFNTGSGFSTGVTLCDLNQDGWQDIYVCRSGWFEDADALRNQLWMNNGDLTFTEIAFAVDLDDSSHSVHSAFFDYDGDKDLDCFVVNTPVNFDLTFNLAPKNRITPENFPATGSADRLYRNEGDHFVDATVAAGIAYDIAFGLNVSAGDINGDGWTDLYVANDFMQPDFLYISNGDGTFTEKSHSMLGHISFYSMGSDLADINNDGLQDIIVMDMMAQDNYRQKVMMASMNVAGFNAMVDAGYHRQYMHNMLQLNNGNGTFSEISQFAGIDKTDWSWAALAADFDNDGFQDLFMTNGIKRDVTNKDYRAAEDKDVREGKKISLEQALEQMGSNKLNNVIFRNNGDLTFADKTLEWGMIKPSFSNGAAYADLDNDGDLDLVTNNVDDPAFIFRNNSKGNFLKVSLRGEHPNRDGIGAKVYAMADGKRQFREYFPSRGYMSCMAGPLHFGLGKAAFADEVRVVWPGGMEQTLVNVPANQTIILYQKEAAAPPPAPAKPQPLFTDVTNQSGVDFIHHENEFDDFAKEILLPHKMSQFGPSIAVAEVNGDQFEDFYVGGAAGHPGALFFGRGDGRFIKGVASPWLSDKEHEDLGCAFFDADGDGDEDLYVVSGGNEFDPGSPLLHDRLYLNDSRGVFTRSYGRLPNNAVSGSCAVPGDYDDDGDMDLFVGGRVEVQKYPFPPQSCLLRNDKGIFSDVTAEAAPSLQRAGMVTSAVWTDYDSDGDKDLFVAGEWMPLTLFRNNKGSFENITAAAGLEKTTGWWNRIIEADLDGDGGQDYVAGNYGLNSKFKVTEAEPLHVYCHDFDNSGTLDIVLGYYNAGVCFPVRGRQCSSEQMPMIKKKFPTYHDFGSSNLEQIYGEGLQKALHYEAVTFASVLIRNKEGIFTLEPMPARAQFSALFAFIVHDFTGDGPADLLAAGNFFAPEVETGRNDAGTGVLFAGDGKGDFREVDLSVSGFFENGDLKDMVIVNNGEKMVITAGNSGVVKVYRVNRNEALQ